MGVEESQIKKIGDVLNNKDLPLKKRFRALFTLKNLGGNVAIDCIAECFKDDSALLKHELAYCLGQMQDKSAIPILTKILEDVKQEPMVRHEAGEALGAIGTDEVIPILTKYLEDECTEVRETCEIALDRVKYLKSIPSDSLKDNNPYKSVDPSPPAQTQNIAELKKLYISKNESLFNRYRAMFSLRNLNTEESALAIAEGLNDPSALFRHEVAFVLGQVQKECTIPHLRKNLENPKENEMVRHECAEALGAIATEDCINILNRYLKDNQRVVKESCEIALDMCEYENSPEFQYANALT
ncbi:deoxyhypusine hydroxylase [Condylostylus longicornis]|uniref:deoxyhypusine hydroxylase n=1 Tax=Condylostylus longicornis TaxID=2530218 RepID=UPI00244DC322|nr:deoxyhypusine hydroxylase [Condylostylus longicornis]